MKKFLMAVLLGIFTLSLFATDNKLYIWVKYPKRANYAYGLEIAVNNKRMGTFKVKELAELHLKGNKKYQIEILDMGRAIGSAQIESLNDSISYYQLSFSAGFASVNFSFDKLSNTEGGMYVMQSSNYTKKLAFYEEGTEGADRGEGFGTGFQISAEGYIVTNNHVVDGAKKIQVKGIDGDYTTEYGADVIAKDANNDLVILQLKNKNIKFNAPPFTLRSQGANTGEDVWVLGYPLKTVLGEEIKLTTGVISSKSGYEGNISSYQVSAPVQPGNSGGPLFDKDGNLIGIINAHVTNTENVSYAIKAVYLQALLGMLPAEPKLTEGNTLRDKILSEKVSAVSKFVYIIETE